MLHIHTTIQVIYAEKGYYLWVGNIVTMSFTYFHLHLSAFTSSRIETAHSQPTKNTICHNGKKATSCYGKDNISQKPHASEKNQFHNISIQSP
ncbi:hypothetical protein BACINT_03133 [Bacteroides intestinalis DSM 17393]|uniref:Uncharacterized protein n=2 Tax=Bacteroides intestinalis TaxID=329854 RepID=B3CI47_9BACE|nr:hypothetical protein BACINT_03133 [Bacteroides intestinalis DSM 17393]